jgi:hypothetical protein
MKFFKTSDHTERLNSRKEFLGLEIQFAAEDMKL